MICELKKLSDQLLHSYTATERILRYMKHAHLMMPLPRVNNERRKWLSSPHSCTEIAGGISNNTYDGNTFGSQIVISTLDLSKVEDRFYVECCANNSVGFDCETSLIEKGIVRRCL